MKDTKKTGANSSNKFKIHKANVNKITLNKANSNDQQKFNKKVTKRVDKKADNKKNRRFSFGDKLNTFLAKFRQVDENFFDELEEVLIQADVGYEVAMELTDQLREESKLKKAKKKDEIRQVILDKLVSIYDSNLPNKTTDIILNEKEPNVLLFVGVNGVGKTTSIGKLANFYHNQGKKVLLVAADTFRAGAIEQLDKWSQRDHVDIVKNKLKSDPAAVVYEALEKGKKENYDVILVDTAGRLQNKVNLMNELAKIKKVITRAISSAPQETLLVLDATTGQNALHQVEEFKKIIDISGIILTKMDGTAQGGIVLALNNSIKVPVKYVGLGEKVEDLQSFSSNKFISGLLTGLGS